MQTRLEAMLQAVRTVRPALETFYQTLNDEQKARFNALGPEDDREQQQARRDLSQACGERASGIASLPIERIARSVQPDDAQRVALKELEDATAGAVSLLKSECPTYRPLTPVGRIEAMEQRLDAMLRAVQTVQPALERFYSSLSDEQKERFNRLSPAQGLMRAHENVVLAQAGTHAAERAADGSPLRGDDSGRRSKVVSLRRDAHLGRGRAHVGVDVLLVLGEVLLEHAHELARGLVEGGFVLPGLHRIEEVRLDARHRGRHREAEIGIGAEAHVLERAVERAGDQRARRP